MAKTLRQTRNNVKHPVGSLQIWSKTKIWNSLENVDQGTNDSSVDYGRIKF